MLLADRSATRPSRLAPEDCDDAAWIAQRMVLDAGAHAARLRRQASAQAATIREAAERETEMIWQQASAQAAAIREAAEREAAALRATVMRLSAAPAELVDPDGGMAGQQAAKLAGQPGTRTAGTSATKPEARPGARRGAEPGARRGAEQGARRETEPGARLGAEPRTGPARRPQRPPRQLVAIRVAAAATAALLLFAVTAGTTEVALHGFAFFVFRAAGTGETRASGLQEDQGPGQPDALKPTPSHIKVASHIKAARPAHHSHLERNGQ
jgi:hypothetical protein